MASKHLKEFLSSLLVYINKNYDSIDKETLLPLIKSKLQDLNIPVNTENLEAIYAKLAVTHMFSSSFKFNQVDVKAIESMRKGFYWAGVEYNKKTQDKLKDTIEGAFKGEYPRAELSAKLKEEFTGVLNASTEYFEGVADHIINQSQNISRVNQALKYDVKYFKIVAHIDNRTSQICRSMHGKIIEAQHLSNQVDNVLAAKNISEKKSSCTVEK
jgi:SPP1 gp7 family putative phage head morphogenesis protein